MLHNIFKILQKLVEFRVYMSAAQDKAGPPGNFDNSNSQYLIQRGLVCTTTKIRNVHMVMSFPYKDSTSGKIEADVFECRTSPDADADYLELPIGSIAIHHTVASTVVTDADIWIHKISGYAKVLTDNGPDTIDCIATTARATANGNVWDGLRIKSKCPTGVTISGEQRGLYIETEVTGTGISGTHYGLKIETYVESTATLGDHYGMGIYTYDNRAGSNQLHVMRLEHNGANVGNAFLGCFAASGKMAYLLESSTTDDSWMSITTTPTCSNAGGWERVKYGGYVRYRQLWTTIS